jgi:hypothetical protein
MAEKTIVEQAGVVVGVGIAAASDVAGAVKTAFDAAVSSVGDVLKKAPAKKAAKKAVTKKAAKRAPAKAVAKKAPAKKAAKKAPAKKTAAKKTPAKKLAAKKAPAKKAGKKSVKTPAKQAARLRR